MVTDGVVNVLSDVINRSFSNVARRLTGVAKHVDGVDVIEFGKQICLRLSITTCVKNVFFFSVIFTAIKQCLQVINTI